MIKYPLLQDVDWLRARYVEDRLSTIKIAVLAGVPNANASVARKALQRAGIERRTISETRSLENLPPVIYTEKACTHCGEVKPLETGFYVLKGMRDGRQSWCKACIGVLGNENTRKVRLATLRALGNQCAGCGESDEIVLTIDHVAGGGNLHRKASRNPYSYYKGMMNHLEDYQILCWNCNHRKRIMNGEHRRSSDSPSADDDGAELLI